jgi:hypothetical protein
MSNERREPMQNKVVRSSNPAGQEQSGTQGMNGGRQRERHGPFTYAVGWLGTAFDRSRVDKREAEERRRRNM